MIAPGTLYKTKPECPLTVFDLRRPGAKERLCRELVAWWGFARTEMLTDGRAVLVMRPGGGMR
jgi:hypothetical protein